MGFEFARVGERDICFEFARVGEREDQGGSIAL
jgi:hypothetical protein